MFDKNRDNKLYWHEFTDGIRQCMCSTETELDEFIFQFFCMNGYSTLSFPDVGDQPSSLKNSKPF